ncbi:MAG: hypothetical protein WDO16_10875 [Bacteroidota bacterium]
MYRLIATIFILVSINSNAQRINPPLLVPYFPTTVPVVEEKIFLPAYNMDMLRPWPDDLHTYNSIVHGSNGTVISIRKKNQVQKIKLEQAIRNKDVNVFSITATVYGRNPGLVIEPLDGVTLVSLQTRGFVITDSSALATVSHPVDTTQYKVSAGGYDLNTMHVYTYKLNQQDVWKKVYKPVVDNPAELKKADRVFCSAYSHRHGPVTLLIIKSPSKTEQSIYVQITFLTTVCEYPGAVQPGIVLQPGRLRGC